MKTKLFIVALLIITLLTNPGGIASAQAPKLLPSGISYTDIGPRIEAYVAEHQATTAGLGVAVFDAKETIYENAFGYADIAGGLPVTPDTVFEWGSITKLLTWVSVMQLEEQGLIDLESDIKTYLPEGFMTNLKFSEPITMLNLMNHTPGFQEQLANIFVDPEVKAKGLAEALQEYPPAQIYPPGALHAYSNWGVALAGYIVERLSNQPFYQYVHENIFQPLNMTHTALSPDLSDNPGVQNARRQLRCYTAKLAPIPECRFQIPLYPAGMATGTLSDLMAFGQALAGAKASPAPLFKSAATAEKMFQPSSYFGESGVGLNSHGFWSSFFKVRTLGHAGNTAGSSSMLQFDPESGVGVAVMTNQAVEEVYNANMMELIFGKFADSDLANYNTRVPSGFFRPARTILQGPLSLNGAVLSVMDKSDLDTFWVLEQKNGMERLYYTYSDLTKLSTWEVAVIFLLLGGLLLGLLFALYNLIGDGLIGGIVRRRKQKISGEAALKDPQRRWRLIASTLQVLLVLNLLVFAVQAVTFQPLQDYLWQCILFGLLAIGMLLLMGLSIRWARQPGQKKPKWLSVATFIFLALAVINVVHWQLYRFWAV